MLFGPKDLFEKKETKLLNEARGATSTGGDKINFIVYVSPERGRNASGFQSYFKYKPVRKYDRRAPVARISFRGAGYIEHSGSSDGPKYELENKECDFLNVILSRKYDENDTVWVYLIKQFNQAQGTSMYENIYSYYANNVPPELPFVPIDQPIPNYSELKNRIYFNKKKGN